MGKFVSFNCDGFQERDLAIINFSLPGQYLSLCFLNQIHTKQLYPAYTVSRLQGAMDLFCFERFYQKTTAICVLLDKRAIERSSLNKVPYNF